MSFHKNHWLLFSVIFFGYIALAWIAGIGPAIWVQDHSRALPGAKPMTPIERRGLEVYIAEGCIACHTQQVRPLKMDAVWGRPSAPGDYAYVKPLDFWRPYAPAVLGSERTGPDLTSIGVRQPSETWQYLHLYNPRTVSPDSIMPAFPWLFEVVAMPPADAVVVPLPPAYAPASGKIVATDRAKALVAYLLSLKQVPLPASGAPAQPTNAAIGTGGAALYSNHCASCHQANGQGLAGVFPPLANDPVVVASDPSQHIATVLHGAQGRIIDGVNYAAAMPAFADQLSDVQIAAIIDHERSSWGNRAPSVTAKDIATVRNGGTK
jgi:cytochrome c oxidase cbb3-type subunit 2